MALSNWAMCGIDNKNKLTSTIVGFDGHGSCEIYKNHLYIRHDLMWAKDSLYIKPTIMEVQSGDIRIDRFQILAERSEYQNAIFTLIMAHDKEYENWKWLAGIGCYGYDERGEWIGVHNDTYQEFLKFLNKLVKEDDYPYDRASEWIKALPNNPTFINQGDAYFAENLGFDTPIQKEGDTKEPIIMQLMDNIK